MPELEAEGVGRAKAAEEAKDESFEAEKARKARSKRLTILRQVPAENPPQHLSPLASKRLRLDSRLPLSVCISLSGFPYLFGSRYACGTGGLNSY
jgi:hypothetical protein